MKNEEKNKDSEKGLMHQKQEGGAKGKVVK